MRRSPWRRWSSSQPLRASGSWGWSPRTSRRWAIASVISGVAGRIHFILVTALPPNRAGRGCSRVPVIDVLRPDVLEPCEERARRDRRPTRVDSLFPVGVGYAVRRMPGGPAHPDSASATAPAARPPAINFIGYLPPLGSRWGRSAIRRRGPGTSFCPPPTICPAIRPRSVGPRTRRCQLHSDQVRHRAP
jgi:hypothetical protein